MTGPCTCGGGKRNEARKAHLGAALHDSSESTAGDPNPCEIVKEWERLHNSEIVPQAPRGPMTIICLAGWEGFRNPLTGRTV